VTRGVEIAKSTCWADFLRVIDNNFVGLSPQKPGGVAMPSQLEKEIANVDRRLRERKFPVFLEEVL
jgi:hypothetical protein